MSTDELLHALYEVSIGHKREDQLRLVLLALLSNALESDDPRSGVWAELFKDIYAESCAPDWAKLKAELLVALEEATEEALNTLKGDS
tara:strand:+ start:46 stop:309 length:264 start_codon:yes stop_codon:yes gene_type:complete